MDGWDRVSLLRLLTEENSECIRRYSQLLGFRRTADKEGQNKGDNKRSKQVSETARQSPPQDPNKNLMPLPFIIPIIYESLKQTDGDTSKTSDSKPVLRSAYNVNEILKRTFNKELMVSPPPLLPWPEVSRKIAILIRKGKNGRDVDVDKTIELLSEGQQLNTLPFQTRNHWPAKLWLIVDRSYRLTPFWHDQDQVVQGLTKLYGKSSLKTYWVADNMLTPIYWERGEYQPFKPSPGDSILLLSDAGFFCKNDRITRQWSQFGICWSSSGVYCNLFSLSRVSSFGVHKHLYKWHVMNWERYTSFNDNGHEVEPLIDQLLMLLSPAIRVEPGLLRETRLLVGGECKSAHFESLVWTHASVSSGCSVALTFRPENQRRLRALFSEFGDKDLKNKVIALIRKYHIALPKEIWYEELLVMDEDEQQPYKEELAYAEQDIISLAMALHQGSEAFNHQQLSEGLPAWFYRLHSRTVTYSKLWGKDSPSGSALTQALHNVMGHVNNLDIPEDDEIEVDPSLLETKWSVCHSASGLVVSRDDVEGAYVARMIGAVPEINYVLKSGTLIESKRLLLEDDSTTIPLFTSGTTTIKTDQARLTLAPFTKPKWAQAIGRDKYGLWMGMSCKNVNFRLRWIPPGEFDMGSPPEEQGRWEYENKHHVVLTKGFWLAETPCTQALWEAVMGKNPSRFKSADRPVEQVSWDDCTTFLERMTGLLSNDTSLQFNLPTEAQWEYACRAGTATATYAGEIEILGERNAPILDEIAWYGGNSGKEFDLENGYDSSGWKEKQYEHKQAGTRIVAQKKPNAWGLYDMLGNVWEWCADFWQDNLTKDETDPNGLKEGSDRVCRGGSWDFNARYVRAAYRDRDAPDFRDSVLGFRFSPGPAGQVSRRAGRLEEGTETKQVARGTRGGRHGRSGKDGME